MKRRLLAIAAGSQFTLRAHLLAYGLCVTVPVLVLLGIMLMRAHALERKQLESRMLQVVSSVADDIDREIDRRLVVLQTLSSSPLLAAEDWPAFYTQAKAALQGRAYLILIEAEGGRQVLNTYVPYAEAPTTTGDRETLRTIRETKQPVVSNLFTSLVVKAPVFNISIPIVQAGQVRYQLSLGLLPTDLLQILQGQELAPGWATSIWDRNDLVLARSADHERYVGKPVPPALGRGRLAFDRVVSADNLDGVHVLLASTPSKLSGWRVAVNVPVATVEAPLTALWQWGAATLGALLLAVLGGLLLARNVASPIASISSAAVALGHGQPIAPRSSLLREANDLFATLLKAQSELDARAIALQENEAMLRTLLEANSVHARDGDLTLALGQIVDAAMAIAHSDMGNIQLYDPAQRHLKIVAHRGFAPPFLAFWNAVSANEGTCGTALGHGERVFVEDIRTSPIFTGTPALAVQLAAQVHAVISTPIVSRSGQPLGVVSTHYKAPHQPEARILPFLDLLARQAADIIEREQAEQQQTLLTNELNHRVKNTLAIIQAIASQTLRRTPEPREFTERFSARLAALATAHNLTMQRAWQHASLEDVVRAALAPFSASSDRFIIAADGNVLLPANLAISFSLMLHELATNAAKYGALSAANGRVQVEWRSENGRVNFTWREEDGPHVAAPPSREGFGSQLIALSVAQLQGTLAMDYLQTGLCARISFPQSAGAGGLEAEAGRTSA